MNSIVRQAKKMQSRIVKVREELSAKRVEASTGGGMVTAVVNGDSELLELRINPDVVDPDDVEVLEEMIIGAVNQAMKTSSEMMNAEIEKVTGGLNLPGLF